MTNLKGKIVFTGGHHTSALAVALELKKKGYEIYWLGHKFSMWGDKNPSAEFREVTASGIPFYELKAGKFHRTYNPLKLARIPVGFWQAFRRLREIKPDLIVSFGSYLAVPVALVGWLLGIPVVTHEQTPAAVISNQIVALVAKKIFVAFSSSLPYFPKGKTVVVGLPLADELVAAKDVEGKARKRETIFITGGKQGAHVINQIVTKIMPRLVERYSVVHQTGSFSVFNDFEAARMAARELAPGWRRWYRVVDFLPREEMVRALLEASLVVSRSGAHTVYELGLLGIPALFIPIPGRTKEEQVRGAEILVKAGSAETLEQRDLTPERLLSMINSMMKEIGRYRTNAKAGRRFFPTDARQKMVQAIERIMGNG